MNKPRYVHSGILSSNKENNELANHKKKKNTWRKLKCIFLSEKSQSEKTTYYYMYDSNYMTLQERQDYESKNISGHQ